MTISDAEIKLLRKRLFEVEAERDQLQQENTTLRERLVESHRVTPNDFPVTQDHVIHSSLSDSDKLSLFRSLFRGRQDVYPVRWENQHGRAGYSPACIDGPGGRRQDTGSPHEERRITASTRVAAGNAGLTRYRLVWVAPGYHTSLHETATEGKVAWRPVA